jgi:hypothetical protein
MEMEQGKKRTIAIIVGSVVVAIVAVLVWWLWPRTPTHAPLPQSNSTSTSGITSLTFDQSVYQVALQRAESWQSDAALITMTSGDTSGQRWHFVFVSQKINGQAFDIAMNGQSVVSADQVPFSGSGAPLPQNIISPDQALANGHAVPGYATSTIQSVQLIYNATAKQWYWAMKRSNGFVTSVKATQ